MEYDPAKKQHWPVCRACGTEIQGIKWPPGAAEPDPRCNARVVFPAYIVALDGEEHVGCACNRECFEKIEYEKEFSLYAIDIPEREATFLVIACDVRCGRCNLKGHD